MFVNPGLDITNDILASLNRSTAAVGTDGLVLKASACRIRPPNRFAALARRAFGQRILAVESIRPRRKPRAWPTGRAKRIWPTVGGLRVRLPPRAQLPFDCCERHTDESELPARSYLAYGRTPVVQTPRKQRTIAEPAALEGFGYWSGKDVRVEFRPAPEHTGIVFVRGDLVRRVRIPVSVFHRVEVPRRTTLGAGGATVEMVEHLLAALYGLQIDNCEVWIDQPELPGLRRFFAAVCRMPRSRRHGRAECLARISSSSAERFASARDDSWIEARPATPGSGLSARYRLDYGLGNGIGRQTYQVHVMPETFRTRIGPLPHVHA